jgi:hypothetical protein
MKKIDIDVNQKFMMHVFNRKNLIVRTMEGLLAAFLSIAIHSMAYDYGDKYDNMDIGQQEN